MRLSRFFIDRPIFAAVIAVIITLVGAISYVFLPVSQYPEVVPPTVTVTASYPGASAETLADTVANPIEQEINGVDGMLYLSSQSTGDGRVTITVTFKQGTDLDQAQTLVQNRVAIAQPRLPEEVQRLGIVTRKTTPDFLLIVNLISPDGSLDREYMTDYAQTRIKDRLARVEGVGDVQLFGSRDLAMRVWIDPGRAAALDLTAGDIVSALRAQNVQVAAGTLGQPPSPGSAFQLNVETQGRFTDPQQFENVVIRTDGDGQQVRVGDVARVEIGADSYSTSAYLNDRDSVIIPVLQEPGSNALAASKAIKAEMETLAKDFPPGLQYRIVYNPTEFIQQSVDAVVHTLLEAIALVVLVIVVFLQKWRASVIPVLAIPVSLIGTFGARSGRILAQQPLAVRTGAGDRHRGRRCDRCGRERRAQSRERHDSAPGVAHVDGRGRRGTDRDRLGVVCGVRADAVHRRPFGRVLQAVRRHHLRRDGDFADCLAHAVSGTVGLAAAAAPACARRCLLAATGGTGW